MSAARLLEYRRRVNAQLTELDLARRRYREEAKALTAVDERLSAAREAQQLVQSIAQEVQQRAHTQIASVVSQCLEAVFDEPYRFQIIFEQKRGTTEARLIFDRDEAGEVDPMSASGGGVVDVAAFALRLACLLLSRPQRRRVVILDEPFKFVSASYRPRLRTLLESLAREKAVQFIIVTHINELKIGNIIELIG